MTQSVFGRNPKRSRWSNVQEPCGPGHGRRTALARRRWIHAALVPNGREVAMNRNFTILVGLAIIGAVVAGCGSAKKTATSTTAPTPGAAMADLTGTWSGQGAIQGQEAPVALRLVQNGSALDGDVYVSGHADLSGPIKGTVEGNTVRLALGNGSRQTSALHISPDGNQISGDMVGSPLVLRRSQ